jgi:hypothetical protein
MRFLALALALLSFSVHAELYRWIDRASGSVKYSSNPPPSTDYARAGEGIQPQIAAYQTLSRELDRLDPAGADLLR